MKAIKSKLGLSLMILHLLFTIAVIVYAFVSGEQFVGITILMPGQPWIIILLDLASYVLAHQFDYYGIPGELFLFMWVAAIAINTCLCYFVGYLIQTRVSLMSVPFIKSKLGLSLMMLHLLFTVAVIVAAFISGEQFGDSPILLVPGRPWMSILVKFKLVEDLQAQFDADTYSTPGKLYLLMWVATIFTNTCLCYFVGYLIQTSYTSLWKRRG